MIKNICPWLVLAIVLFFQMSSVLAQQYITREYTKDEIPDLSIPENTPSGVTSTLNIPDSHIAKRIDVYVDITHTYIGDLILRVTSPTGEQYTLHNMTGGSAEDIRQWYSNISLFAGDNIQGNWRLFVSDNLDIDIGTLNFWKVRAYIGSTDIVFRHTSGSAHSWLILNSSIGASQTIGGTDPQWKIVGLDDFNGDTYRDILLRHQAGSIYTWLMEEATVVRGGSSGFLPTEWQIVGVGDFSGDDKADILVMQRSGTSRAIHMFYMNGTSIVGGNAVGSLGEDWNVAAIGDFNGDGKSDILWQHTAGTLTIWHMNSSQIIGGGSPAVLPSGWKVAGIGDFNGDGKSDILLQQTSGDWRGVHIWHIDGATIIGSNTVGSVPQAYAIVNVADYNLDGKSDILFHYQAGEWQSISTWLMNGSTIIENKVFGYIQQGWSVMPTADVWTDDSQPVREAETYFCRGADPIYMQAGEAPRLLDISIDLVPQPVSDDASFITETHEENMPVRPTHSTPDR